MEKNYLEPVKQQYEELPYPARNPADDPHRLVQTIGDNLLVANHFCFRGRRDFSAGFRCLVAGGGTGDSLIYLAEQLRHFDAEVVYVDLSTASRAIAEERARRRKLDNIRFITGSILDLPRMGLGEFDYINCSGVLHHLESTERGLAALNAVMKDDGAMFLMLYGAYARREIYDTQAMLRAYLPPGIGTREKIAMARALLATLPESNGFRRNFSMWEWEIAPDGGGDSGLFDLLLHSQDRCFDVPGIYALAAGEGLHVGAFPMGADRYEPANLVADPEVRRRLASFPLPQRRALAEQISGVLRTHEFYLTRHPDTAASPEDESRALMLFWTLFLKHRELSGQMQPGQPFEIPLGERTMAIVPSEAARVLIAGMGGNITIGELLDQVVATVPGVSRQQARQELRTLYDFLHPAGYLYLLEKGSLGNQLPDFRRF